MLITGNPGIGKSELTLSLIDRHHFFIADDAVLIDSKLNMSSPTKIRGRLFLREIGMINIAKLYPNQCVKKKQTLNLIIDLKPPPLPEITQLYPIIRQKKILNHRVPLINLHIHHTVNLALKVETLVKQYKLER